MVIFLYWWKLDSNEKKYFILINEKIFEIYPFKSHWTREISFKDVKSIMTDFSESMMKFVSKREIGVFSMRMVSVVSKKEKEWQQISCSDSFGEVICERFSIQSIWLETSTRPEIDFSMFDYWQIVRKESELEEIHVLIVPMSPIAKKLSLLMDQSEIKHHSSIDRSINLRPTCDSVEGETDGDGLSSFTISIIFTAGFGSTTAYGPIFSRL